MIWCVCKRSEIWQHPLLRLISLKRLLTYDSHWKLLKQTERLWLNLAMFAEETSQSIPRRLFTHSDATFWDAHSPLARPIVTVQREPFAGILWYIIKRRYAKRPETNCYRETHRVAPWTDTIPGWHFWSPDILRTKSCSIRTLDLLVIESNPLSTTVYIHNATNRRNFGTAGQNSNDVSSYRYIQPGRSAAVLSELIRWHYPWCT